MIRSRMNNIGGFSLGPEYWQVFDLVHVVRPEGEIRLKVFKRTYHSTGSGESDVNAEVELIHGRGGQSCGLGTSMGAEGSSEKSLIGLPPA